MSWLNDIESILVAAGVGTATGGSINIFTSTAAKIPAGAGPYLSIMETGGYPSERTHDSAPGQVNERSEGPGDAYEQPTAQILVRAQTYRNAKTMLKAARKALIGVRNEEINGTWYREIVGLQPPFDMGLDDSQRARVAFNVRCIKVPS